MTTEDAKPATEGFVCSRCKAANPPLERPPLPNELGRKVHASICKTCWQEWLSVSVRLVNEYRLDLMSPEASAFYDRCLADFLGVAR